MAYKVPNQITEPDPVQPNQGLHHQIVMCKQKREQSMTEVTDSLLFLGLCPSSNFLKKHDVTEASSVSVFRPRTT